MHSKRPVVDDIPKTPHFDFLYGRYHLSSWLIPYFSTTMSLRDAATSLRLADFPGSDDITWRLDELYQREVDWPRVERQIVPYLRAADQPQFFNALTIALLPTGHSLSDTEHAFVETRNWRPPTLTEPKRFEKIITVGPITCGYWNDWAQFSQPEARTGQMRWNPDEVFAVALDGQHRLAAMQRFVENPGISDDQLRATAVPVIFVTLDRRFGYVSPGARSLVDVMRIIFVDLNKHAQKPTRTREILLDDKDPTSVCVRALVGETVTGDIVDLAAQPPRLPLALVDWHTEQAKCESGPYVTTILTLDWAITALLGARPVQNFMDYPAIKLQVQALARWLSIDMTQALERLGDLEEIEVRPFSYSDSPENNELEHIAHAFQQIWNPVFICLLTEFAPYRDLIALRSPGSFTLDFAHWYRLYHRKNRDSHRGRATRDYDDLVIRLKTRHPSPVGEKLLAELLHEDIEEAHKSHCLAYNVVFQRAYFLAFSDWLRVADQDLEEIRASDAEEGGAGEETDDDDDDGGSDTSAAFVLERARQFVRCMNALADGAPDILHEQYLFEPDGGEERRFWLGTLFTGTSIDFTQSASKRGKEVLFWVVAMQMYRERRAPGEEAEFGELWAEIQDADLNYTRRLRGSVRRFAAEGSAGSRILKARQEEFDRDKSREEARARMKWLWDLMTL